MEATRPSVRRRFSQAPGSPARLPGRDARGIGQRTGAYSDAVSSGDSALCWRAMPVTTNSSSARLIRHTAA